MRGIGLFVILLSLLLSNRAIAKPRLRITTGGIELSSPDPIFTDNAKTVTIPIKRAGNLIIVEAQVDSIAGNFVLDTGAPYLVLNATYFRDMPHLADRESNGINGTAEGTFKTQVKNFNIGFDLHYNKLMADVIDLSAIENSKKIKILGLLGTQIFRKIAITVDLFHNVMYLHKLDSKGNLADQERPFAQPDMKTSFKNMNDVLFIQGVINNKKLWFAFDTGAESNLLHTNASSKILKVMTIINKSKIVGVGGSGYEIIYANFDKLTIESYVFNNNRILLANLDHLGKAYGQSVDAVLGYDFFSRGIFTINFVKNEFEMYIYKH
jgi:predicted aspartyl protease